MPSPKCASWPSGQASGVCGAVATGAHDGAEEGWFKGSLEGLLSDPGTEISWTLCPQHGLALKGELEQFTYLDAEIESDE
jgi:hypothetical protein